MIASMTAFSREQAVMAGVEMTCEIRTVNHRYCDVSLRLPESLRSCEKVMRDCVLKTLSRGKVEVSVRVKEEAQEDRPLTLNTALVAQLVHAEKSLSQMVDTAPMDGMRLLAWPGVMTLQPIEDDALQTEALSLLDRTLSTLKTMRQEEGAGLARFLKERIAGCELQVSALSAQLPVLLQAQEDKLKARFEAASIDCEPERLAQEMVILAQKTDVAEELHRLQAHCDAVTTVLKKGGVVGRRLDFLMQELGREANTLSSKAFVVEMTNTAVELKVLIEQMREQVQNIE